MCHGQYKQKPVFHRKETGKKQEYSRKQKHKVKDYESRENSTHPIR